MKAEISKTDFFILFIFALFNLSQTSMYIHKNIDIINTCSDLRIVVAQKSFKELPCLPERLN